MERLRINLNQFLNSFWKNLFEESNEEISEIPENLFNDNAEKEEFEQANKKTYDDVLKFPIFSLDYSKNPIQKTPLDSKNPTSWKSLKNQELILLWKSHFEDVEREYLVAILKALEFNEEYKIQFNEEKVLFINIATAIKNNNRKFLLFISTKEHRYYIDLFWFLNGFETRDKIPFIKNDLNSTIFLDGYPQPFVYNVYSKNETDNNLPFKLQSPYFIAWSDWEEWIIESEVIIENLEKEGKEEEENSLIFGIDQLSLITFLFDKIHHLIRLILE